MAKKIPYKKKTKRAAKISHLQKQEKIRPKKSSKKYDLKNAKNAS